MSVNGWNQTKGRPLNLIGMPHYTEPLLSNFPESDYAPVTSPLFNPPEPIPNSVLNTMKMVDFVGYATTPRELRGKRYVVTARPGAGKYATGKGYTYRRESAPKFRSEKDRKGRQSISGEQDEEVRPMLSYDAESRSDQARYQSTTARSRSNTQSSVSRTLTLASTTGPSTAVSRLIFSTRTQTLSSRLCTIPRPFEMSPRPTYASTAKRNIVCCVRRDSCSACWRTPRGRTVKRATFPELSAQHHKVSCDSRYAR